MGKLVDDELDELKPVPAPSPKGSEQLAVSTALTAIYMLVGAAWFPLLMNEALISVEFVALVVSLGVLNWKKRGPSFVAVLGGVLLGFFVALAVAGATTGSSPLPAWLQAHAQEIQAVAGLAGLGILVFQSRFISWQTKLAAHQAEISQRLLILEGSRDLARFHIENAQMVSSRSLELTLINRGKRGSEVESITACLAVEGREPVMLTADLQPARLTSTKSAANLFIAEGTRRTLHAAFHEWPEDLAGPATVEVRVTPVLGETATYTTKHDGGVLSGQQLLLAQHIFDYLGRNGHWPKFLEIERPLATQMNVEEVYRGLMPAASWLPDEMPIRIETRHLLKLERIEDHLRPLVRALPVFVDRYLRSPHRRISEQDLQSAGFTPEEAMHVYRLAAAFGSGIFAGGSGSTPHDRTFNMDLLIKTRELVSVSSGRQFLQWVRRQERK